MQKMQKSILETKEQNPWGQEIELVIHKVITKYPKSKDRKACTFVIYWTGRLVWFG